MDRSALSVVALFNTCMTAEEQVWSRREFLTLSVNGEALPRLENVPQGEGADALTVMKVGGSESFVRYSPTISEILGHVICRIEQF